VDGKIGTVTLVPGQEHGGATMGPESYEVKFDTVRTEGGGTRSSSSTFKGSDLTPALPPETPVATAPAGGGQPGGVAAPASTPEEDEAAKALAELAAELGVTPDEETDTPAGEPEDAGKVQAVVDDALKTAGGDRAQAAQMLRDEAEGDLTPKLRARYLAAAENLSQPAVETPKNTPPANAPVKGEGQPEAAAEGEQEGKTLEAAPAHRVVSAATYAKNPEGAKTLSQHLRDAVLARPEVRNALGNSPQNAGTEILSALKRELGKVPGEHMATAGEWKEDYDAINKEPERLAAKIHGYAVKQAKGKTGTMSEQMAEEDQSPMEQERRELGRPDTFHTWKKYDDFIASKSDEFLMNALGTQAISEMERLERERLDGRKLNEDSLRMNRINVGSVYREAFKRGLDVPKSAALEKYTGVTVKAPALKDTVEAGTPLSKPAEPAQPTTTDETTTQQKPGTPEEKPESDRGAESAPERDAAPAGGRDDEGGRDEALVKQAERIIRQARDTTAAQDEALLIEYTTKELAKPDSGFLTTADGINTDLAKIGENMGIVERKGGSGEDWAFSALWEERLHWRQLLLEGNGDRFLQVYADLDAALVAAHGPEYAEIMDAVYGAEMQDTAQRAAEWERILAQHRSGVDVTELHYRDIETDERLSRLVNAEQPQAVEDHLAARNLLSRPPHRGRWERGAASGSEGV
jgi:hypothetical protein